MTSFIKDDDVSEAEFGMSVCMYAHMYVCISLSLYRRRMYTHTPARAHARTYTCACVRAHAVCVNEYMNTCTCVRSACMNAHTHTHACVYTQAYFHTCIWAADQVRSTNITCVPYRVGLFYHMCRALLPCHTCLQDAQRACRHSPTTHEQLNFFLIFLKY